LFAKLAPPRLEPRDPLAAAGGIPDWLAVDQDRVLLPPERDTTERRDQRSATLAALDANLHALTRRVRCSIVAACFRAILETDEPCLPARVLSSEVSITQCSRFSRQTPPASR
jgi:hypothetical protein